MYMIVVKIYSRLLRFYPPRFYKEYAEDMEIVFEMTLHAASHDGTLALLKVCFEELLSLPVAALLQHLQERVRFSKNETETHMITHTRPSQVRFVRWLTRAFGLSATLFYLDTLLRYLPSNPHIMPLTVIFFVTMLSILLAWRVERTGGIITIACGVLVGLAGMYATYRYEQAVDEVIGWVVLLAGILWGFPFLVVGWLFVKVSQATRAASAVNY